MKILILGAGRSATFLIKQMASYALEYDWEVSVAEQSEALLNAKTSAFPHLKSFVLPPEKPEILSRLIAEHNLIVSLLPPSLHLPIAKLCLQFEKHFFTASYLTPALQALAQEVTTKKLLFLMEMGADPGLDHISAMKLIEKIRAEGGIITGFASATGGLIAPECLENNPWQYKITWNPQNIIKAGQDNITQYLKNGEVKVVPYAQIFAETMPIFLANLGEYEMYFNRNALIYKDLYNLFDSKNFLRGTIRPKGFAKAWNILVALGMTNDNTEIELQKNATYSDFFHFFFTDLNNNSFIEQEAMEKLIFLGFHDTQVFPFHKGTPAKFLQHIVEQKWKLSEKDTDLLLMQHKITFIKDKKPFEAISELILKGENAMDTAMAKAVGLPLALAIKHFILKNILLKGIFIPTTPQIYEPIAEELAFFDIDFQEKILPL